MVVDLGSIIVYCQQCMWSGARETLAEKPIAWLCDSLPVIGTLVCPVCGCDELSEVEEK